MDFTQWFKKDLMNDKKYVLQSIKNYGLSLVLISDSLKKDKEVVLKAVKQDGISLKYASPKLRNDKEVVLEAVKQNGKYLEYASEEFKKDKEVVLEAVKQNGKYLEYASEELKKDKEVVFEAVKQNGRSLEYASSGLKNDKEIVLEAVKQSGWFLEYSSSELKNDEDILLSRKITRYFQPAYKFGKGYRYSGNSSSSFGDNFNDLVFHLHLGRGAYGGTYLCTGKKEFQYYVVKIYNDLFAGDEKKKEILSRDCLYIPHHINVVPILKHWTNQTLDLFKLPDYEQYWKEQVMGSRYIPNSGVILMNYYETTLNKYLDARMKKSSRISIIEIRRMFWGLLCGVCHLYHHMVVHRDLHGENIFVNPHNGEIVIGDFGCCLDLRNNKTKFKVHKDHELIFSFTNNTNYKKKHNSECGFRKGGFSEMIPPEIQNFDPLKDEFLDYSKSDIYSLGILGFILLDHLETGDDDFGLSEFMNKLVIEDPKKRLGCFVAMEIGKFIEVKDDEESELSDRSDSDEE